MTEQEINWMYIRKRLRYVMPECLITDELVREIYRMLSEIYEEGKGKGSELTLRRKKDIM